MSEQKMTGHRFFVHDARTGDLFIISTDRPDYDPEDHFPGYHSDCQWGEVTSLNVAKGSTAGQEMLTPDPNQHCPPDGELDADHLRCECRRLSCDVVGGTCDWQHKRYDPSFEMSE
jgi:hypothetical protein